MTWKVHADPFWEQCAGRLPSARLVFEIRLLKSFNAVDTDGVNIGYVSWNAMVKRGELFGSQKIRLIKYNRLSDAMNRLLLEAPASVSALL